jgi:type I restriction enzyme S subunit
VKKYSEYKTSGVDWLGEIPNNWNIIKIKFTDILIMGQSPESKDVTDFEKGLPFLQGNAEFTDTHPIPKNWCEKANKIAIKNDLLLSVRAPVGALKSL